MHFDNFKKKNHFKLIFILFSGQINTHELILKKAIEIFCEKIVEELRNYEL
jgi:hypothetical protein